jgi:outer membrane lipoprotein LolB
VRFPIAALLLAMLSGCAAIPERAPVGDRDAAWAAHARALDPLDAWEIRGRIALRTADDGWQASLLWVRTRDRHDIDLVGPLGSGHVRLRQDAAGAELRDSDRQVLRDSSAENLLLRATGWQLPVNGLSYWVRGLPAPGTADARTLDEWGRLRTLRQLGWQVEFLGYEQFESIELPNKLFISRADAGNRASADAAVGNDPTLEVRLVIDRWSLRR